jgi:hypothetical protein
LSLSLTYALTQPGSILVTTEFRWVTAWILPSFRLRGLNERFSRNLNDLEVIVVAI